MAQHGGSPASDRKEGLHKHILRFCEATFSSLRAGAGRGLNIFRSPFYRVRAIQVRRRFTDSRRPEDVKYSIEYFRFLREQPLKPFQTPRNQATASLVQALALQVELESGDVMHDIEEMTALCRELLASDVSSSHLSSAIVPFSEAFLTRVYLTIQPEVEPLGQVIDCLREALKLCPPDLHQVSLALASALATRFNMTHSDDDYDEATAVLDNIIAAPSTLDNPAPLQVLASEVVTWLAYKRSLVYKTPEYSEEAIFRCRTLLGCSSLPDSIRVDVTQLLATQAQWRFKHFGLMEGLQEASSCVSDIVSRSSLLPLAASEDIVELDDVRAAYPMTAVEEKIQHLEKLLPTTAPGSLEHRACLRGLVDWYQTKFSHTNDLSDIEEAITHGRMLHASTSPNDTFGPRIFLGDALLMAFERNGRTEYLDESIDLHRDVLKIQDIRVTLIRFPILLRLVSSLSTRLRLLSHTQDLAEIIHILPLAVGDSHASVHDRFELSCFWASVSRTAMHASVSTAYESAMSLMQSSLVIAPTLKTQHTCLVAMRSMCETMPLEYVSYQIHTDQVEQAIETLERGRALLWSEMRGLRASVDQLREANSPLAEQFVGINEEIEELITSIAPDASGAAGADDGGLGGPSLHGMDPFGRLVMKQRKLLETREVLVSQIQALPGFENFLKATSFDNLRSAASCGPVIIINHCEWRSDILIVLHDSPPSLIQTDGDFYNSATKLRDRFMAAREGGLDSKKFQRALRSVLEELYELVGRPVIERLRLLGVQEQSRVWWCPTSVFCSLPLHAMGPIPSRDGVKQFFSDLYIPSYTPSLSALIESRKSDPQTSNPPSLLLVAQPDETLPGVWGEAEVIQALSTRLPVESLISEAATPTAVLEALRLGRHQFVHFACHGTLETGKPFDASLKLHGGGRLALLDIARSRPSQGVPAATAELAFLSACHTAELTRESIADEALHLAAAAQYCGFKSVVGTMWEVADTDGRDLAEHFYRSVMLSGDDDGRLGGLGPGGGVALPYNARSAKALRDAVRKLRRKNGVTLERWVNFVHYGA